MQHRILLLLITTALVLPAATATWSVNGAFEPDTLDDIEDVRMWTEPDTETSGRKVYFNALPSDRNGLEFNPNLGALRSRYVPAGQMGMSAWLGVWKDCNRDGYIGHVETLALEYRVELLTDNSVCPPGSAFNKFSWVSEFIYISPEYQNNSAALPRVIYDPAVKVWGDFGRPDNAREVHYDCAQAPFQSGTFDSTGGVLLYFDCQLGYMGAQTANDVDGITGLGIAFDGEGGIYHPERDCDNPLNQHIGLYGRSYCNPDDPGTLEEGADPAARVWDCSSDPTVITDPQDGEPLTSVPALSPAAGNPDGSVFSAAWTTAFRCGEADGSGVFNGEFLLGADFSGTSPADGKRLADFDFGYNMPASSTGTTPARLGVRGPGSGAWGSSVTYLPPTYLGGTVRNGDLSPEAGLWFTFYAHVGPDTTSSASLRTSTPAIYGSEPCGDNDEGLFNGWDCDRTHWWNPEMGGSANADGPRPGDLYHLRDTDCYDGSVSDGVPVYASLAIISAEPLCPTMAPLGLV